MTAKSADRPDTAAAPAAAPAAVFDLAELEAVDSDWLTVKNQAGHPTTWKVHLAGPGHDVTLAAQREAQAERLAKARRIEMAQVNHRKWKGEEVDAEAEAKRSAEQIARRIIGWTPVVVNGQDFPYSAANAVALMWEPRWAFVQVQVVDYLTSETAFTKGSAAS